MRIITLVGAAIFMASPLPSQSLPPDSAVRQWLTLRVENGYNSGIVAGLVSATGSRTVSVGRADDAASRLLDGTSIFEIGSITKVFTTLLLADMVQRGDVALNDPVSKYLPTSVTVPSRGGTPITLLDLATASSGLPGMPSNFTPANPTDPYADYSVAQLYSFLSGYTLLRAPGERYEYSNLGMGLLGHALALRAGKSYEALITERVLVPMGMRETAITLSPPLAQRFVTGHDADLEPVAHWNLPTLAGAGALRSSLNDMMRFAKAIAIRGGPLDAAIRESVAARRPAGQPNMRIGLGWHIREANGRTIVWHNGGTGGFKSFLGIDPDRQVAVVLLTNSTESVDDLGMHMLDASVPLRTIVPRPLVALSASELEPLVGAYALAPTFVLTVTRDGDKLFLQATNQPRFRLWPTGNAAFALRAVSAAVRFERDSTGRIGTLVLDQNGRAQRASRRPSAVAQRPFELSPAGEPIPMG